MSEGGMPTYIAGDTVRVCVEVKPWATGKGIRRVRATFVHEADPTKKLEISDDPGRDALMPKYRPRSGRAEGVGTHRRPPRRRVLVKGMAAEYPRGRMVRFAGAPDAVFRVIEEEIQSLEVSGWRWL